LKQSKSDIASLSPLEIQKKSIEEVLKPIEYSRKKASSNLSADRLGFFHPVVYKHVCLARLETFNNFLRYKLCWFRLERCAIGFLFFIVFASPVSFGCFSSVLLKICSSNVEVDDGYAILSALSSSLAVKLLPQNH